MFGCPDGAHELFPTQLAVLTLIGERLAQLHHVMATAPTTRR